jgi:hypothetical protein
MDDLPPNLRDVDWSLTTWDGSRREQMRRWSERSLEEILRSLEEMQETSRRLQEKVRGSVPDGGG